MNKRLEKAINAHKQGLHEQAEKAYLAVIKKTPKHPDAYYFLGTLYGQTGRFSHAIDSLKKSIKLDPRRIPAHMNLAQALFDSKCYDDAALAYSNALKYNPELFQAHYGLGCTLQAKGDLKIAIEHYQKAITLKPDHIPSHVNLGTCLFRMGAIDNAIETCNKAIAINPSSGDAYRCLGHAVYKKGDIQSARQAFETAIELNSKTPDAYLGLGDTYMDEKKYHDALEPFKQAVALNPSSQDAQIKYETALMWDSSDKNDGLLNTIWDDYFFNDPASSIELCRNLATKFNYDNKQALEALKQFLDVFDPSNVYDNAWWQEKLDAFGTASHGHDKLLRAIFSTFFSWSIPNKQGLQTIADFVGSRRLYSYGAGAGYWEFLLSSKFNVNIAASDIAVRHRFFDVKADNYGSADVNPEDVIFIAWILGNDADVQQVLEKMQKGQAFILVGEPPDQFGIPRICASKQFFDYLEQNFKLIDKQDLVQFSYLNDILCIYEKI